MENFIERLQYIINKLFNGNQAAFARAVNIKPTTLSNYFSDKKNTKPSMELALSIVEILDVDANWLLTGKGDMQKPVQTVHDISNSNVAGVNVSGKEIHIANPEAYNALLETVKTYQKITEKHQSQMDEIIALLKAKM